MFVEIPASKFFVARTRIRSYFRKEKFLLPFFERILFVQRATRALLVMVAGLRMSTAKAKSQRHRARGRTRCASCDPFWNGPLQRKATEPCTDDKRDDKQWKDAWSNESTKGLGSNMIAAWSDVQRLIMGSATPRPRFCALWCESEPDKITLSSVLQYLVVASFRASSSNESKRTSKTRLSYSRGGMV